MFFYPKDKLLFITLRISRRHVQWLHISYNIVENFSNCYRSHHIYRRLKRIIKRNRFCPSTFWIFSLCRFFWLQQETEFFVSSLLLQETTLHQYSVGLNSNGWELQICKYSFIFYSVIVFYIMVVAIVATNSVFI